ncbi:MAG TPA: hypothetical protein VIZ68_00895 [Thermoplasmata archaeon]
MDRPRRGRRGSVLAGWTLLALSLGMLLPSGSSWANPAIPVAPTVHAFSSTTAKENYSPGWSNVSNGLGENEVPPARTGSAGALYPEYSSWVVYGGRDALGSALNDTLLFVTGEGEWDILDEFWNGHRPSSPPPLSGAALAFDAADGYILLFGGELSNGSDSGGTWALSGATWNELRWTQIAPAGPTPPPSSSDRLVYDSTDGYALLYTGTQTSPTWSYRAGVWTPLASPQVPPPRREPALIDDPELGGVVLFGGSAPLPNTTLLNDTWLYRDGNWSRIATPIGPPPMIGPTGVVDGSDGYILMIGETSGGPGGSGGEATWGLTGIRWSNLSATPGPPPPGRQGAVMFYDALDRTVLLYGGTLAGQGTVLGDLWAWNLPTEATDSRTAAFPLSPEVLVFVGIGGVVPPVLAWAFFRRPPRRQPTDVPSPSPAPA